MDTEQRKSPEELLARHRRSMSEAQQLEPSVMVTERNWSAMLEMQDRLFRQQMQLDADLKTLLTKQEAQEVLAEMQMCTEEFARQAGSLSARYSSACKELTDSTQKAVTMISESSKREISAVLQEPTKKIYLCAWISITAVILCAARLGRAVEQMTDSAPQRDGTTTPPHIDSKRQKKLRQKKTALGHAEDDHED